MNKKKVLIIDDDFAHAQFFCAWFGVMGNVEFDSHIAPPYPSIEKILSYDAIITDYDMRYVDGIAEAYKVTDVKPDFNIIILTGHKYVCERNTTSFEILYKAIDPRDTERDVKRIFREWWGDQIVPE